MQTTLRSAPKAQSPRTLTAQPRLLSLDVFRGLTIAAMILVTDPGTYSAVYWPLLHAAWDGATPTDIIFPSFLVIVGISMTLSFAARLGRGETRKRLHLHVLQRAATMFLLGLLVNGFPFYDLHNLRIPGILQRIAICYHLGSLLYLAASDTLECDRHPLRRTAILSAAVIALLALSWCLLKLVPVPGFGPGRLDSLGNLAAYIDRSVFGVRHLWAYGLTPGHGVTFDPEGILSTFPALATLLIGVIAGECLRSKHSLSRKLTYLLLAGLTLAVSGYLLSPLLPLNKKLGTSTFALFSSGIALLAFALFFYLVDLKRWRFWTSPALVLGANAILAFIVSGCLTTVSDRIHVSSGSATLSLHTWIYRQAFATWLVPVHASLAYALSVVALNIALLYPLYRRQIFLHI